MTRLIERSGISEGDAGDIDVEEAAELDTPNGRREKRSGKPRFRG